MSSIARVSRRASERRRLARTIGHEVSRFQESSYAFDQVAAEILALNRADLLVMTMLLFGGAATAEELAASLQMRRSAVGGSLERMQLAGYATFQPGAGTRIELTAHARKWIERIWAPLREEGFRRLEQYSTPHLAVIADFVQHASAIQETRTRKLRSWVMHPSSPARRSHLRGGLSPAALQRAQLFIEANLAAPIHLQDIAARAALSPYHFARAYKTSVGTTPRAFVEQRRIERAKRLLTESTQPIAAVAADSGFATQSRLTTIFRRQTGFTPAAYRRGHA